MNQLNFQIIDQVKHLSNNDMQNRGALFGDGFFTTGIIEDSKFLHSLLHYNRLVESAILLKFELDLPAIQCAVNQVAKESPQCVIRISIERLQTPRGYAIAIDQQVNCRILISPWQPISNQHWQVFIGKTPISVNPLLAGIKHLNRLDNVLAASECTNSQQEALMCHQDSVICGSRTNLFVLQDNIWRTPRIDNAGIRGITRQRVMQLLSAHDIDCLQQPITTNDLQHISAAFVTNSLIGIKPISKLENKALDTDLVEDLQSQIQFIR